MAALLHERLTDACLGPPLTGELARGLESEPMMRYRLIVVASPDHRLSSQPAIPWRALAGEDWLVDPSGADPSTEVGLLLGRLRVPEGRVRVFPTQAAAWSAATEGAGVAPAIGHLVSRHLDRGALVRLDVEATPVDLMWYILHSRPTGDRLRSTPSAGSWPRPRQCRACTAATGGSPPADSGPRST